MTDPFIAEIRIFPFNFPPRGWAWCDGQLLPISQNTALFALLGTTYGGDGKSTFALPDLQGRAAMHPGQGQGLSERFLGEVGGTDTVTLLTSEMPAHNHFLRANTDPANLQVPNPNRVIARSQNGNAYTSGGTLNTTMSPQAIGLTGNSQPHNNLQPYLTLYFNIAIQGVFPQRP